MRRLLSAAGSALVLAFAAAPIHAQTVPGPAQAAAPVTPAEQRKALGELAAALESYFVYPEVGARYAAMLRANAAAGVYAGLTDPAAFGRKVTADLQAVQRDGHLRFEPAVPDEPQTTPSGAAANARPSEPRGLAEARMMGEVAYLRFTGFPFDPAVSKATRDFLTAHADAKALIIDVRRNGGGGLQVADAILPLLYAEKTALLRMDTRAAADRHMPFDQWPSLVRQPSDPAIVRRDHVVTPDPTETRLLDAPVYYLTSKRTASAAEHLALVFRRTHRATLVGETTAGANHFGGTQTFGERFAAFIPVGRTYDPDTGKDWEGDGVAPDVAVPADQALDEALKRLQAAGVKTS